MSQPIGRCRAALDAPPTRSKAALGLLLGLVTLLSGCNGLMPSAGPTRQEVIAVKAQPGSEAIQVVRVTDDIARSLLARRNPLSFSEELGDTRQDTQSIGLGDTIELTIWEAPPASLFGGGSIDPRSASGISTSRPNALPEQVVNSEGTISVPFAGTITVAGRSPHQVEVDVVSRLKGKANQPQVLVRVLRNPSTNVTVLGDVASSVRFPLSARTERVLDALAAAGGTRNPTNKTTVQITRGQRVVSLPLETLIRDPRQNVSLKAGDVVTALYQPFSFIALGASGKNEEVNFEGPGISLAQAMGRMGGLQDNRADPQGVFIFRFEEPGALDWPRQPVLSNAAGKVPVIYTVDMKDPNSFFVMQTFAIRNADLIYVSNAPVAEFQKFANVVFSVAFPVLNTIQLSK